MYCSCLPSDQAHLDELLAALKIPQQHRDLLRLRLEPLKRLHAEFESANSDTTYGLFAMWRPDSVLNGVADLTRVLDMPTCMSLRRACRERGIYVVDNTGLPNERP